MASDQPPDCPFTRYLHHFGAPTPVYFMLHHMYFTYCIIIFILYTLRYFVLYTIYYVRYTIYYILYTIYYILYIYVFGPPNPTAGHTPQGGNTDTSTGGGDPYHGGASNTEHATIYIYIIMYVTIYIYIHMYMCILYAHGIYLSCLGNFEGDLPQNDLARNHEQNMGILPQ